MMCVRTCPTLLRLVGLATLATLSACSPSFWQAMGAATNASSSSNELLLFGGQGHKTFLGCLNCSKYDSGSLQNAYGQYGSRYGAASIMNPYNEFGSKFSATSACNPHAADPPVIVDRGGRFYGRLTMNRYRMDVTKDSALVAWLAAICQR